MYNLYIFTIFSLTALCITASMTNILLFPVKLHFKLIIFGYIIFCQSYLSPIYHQGAAVICVAGIIIILSFSKKYILPNTIFGLSGYIFYVLIDHILLIPLYAINITIEKITQYPVNDVMFVLSLTVVTVLVSKITGKFLRLKFKDFFMTFPRKIQLWFLIESIMCVSVYIYNIIIGEINGYTSDVIYHNGLLFTFLFIILMTVFSTGTYIIRKYNIWQQTRIEEEDMVLHVNNLENIYQEIRTFKHDYKNILSTITLTDDENIEETERIFKTIILPEYSIILKKNEYFKKSLRTKIKNANNQRSA